MRKPIVEWLEAALAVRPTCLNPEAFSALIAEQTGRLLRMELDVAFENVCYLGSEGLPPAVGAPGCDHPNLIRECREALLPFWNRSF